MKTNRIYDTYSSLPSWSRGVIAVVGVGFIVFSSYLIYKGVNKIINPPQSSSDKEAKDELKNLSKIGIKPSYSDAQFSAWCEKLAYALAYNTDEDAIYSIFESLKNEADILKLVEIFGSRKVETFPFVFQEATLSEAVISAMNSSEIAELNNILKKKRINFRF